MESLLAIKSRLISKLDRTTSNLKNVLDHERTVLGLFTFNLIMFLIVSNHCIEVDLGKTLYREGNKIVSAETFKLLYHAFSFYVSTICAIFFAWIARYPKRKFTKSENVDLGFIFISLAATAWAVSSCWLIAFELYKENSSENLQNWISIFLGDLNTYFFLCVIPLLDFYKRPKALARVNLIFDKNFLFALGIFLFLFHVVTYFFLVSEPTKYPEYIKAASLLCNLLAFLIYFIAFKIIFNERIPDFEPLFYISSVLLLAAIITDAIVVFNQFGEKETLLLDINIKIILFIYRPIMLVVLCALTISHFYKTHIDEIREVDEYKRKIEGDLSLKTDLLEKEKSQHEESKIKQKAALEEQRRQMNHSTKNTLSLLYTDLVELLDNDIDLGPDGKAIFKRIQSRITAAQELHNQLHESTIGAVLAVKKTLSKVLDRVKSVYDFKDEKFKVSMDLPDDLYFETTDMRHVNRFIVELLSNICIHAYPGYAPEERTISLDTYLKNGLFIIVVEDEGIGFDTENSHLKKGFGLSYIKRIVEKELSGEFTLQSKIGQGSKFLIKIPTEYTHK